MVLSCYRASPSDRGQGEGWGGPGCRLPPPATRRRAVFALPLPLPCLCLSVERTAILFDNPFVLCDPYGTSSFQSLFLGFTSCIDDGALKVVGQLLSVMPCYDSSSYVVAQECCFGSKAHCIIPGVVCTCLQISGYYETVQGRQVSLCTIYDGEKRKCRGRGWG